MTEFKHGDRVSLARKTAKWRDGRMSLDQPGKGAKGTFRHVTVNGNAVVDWDVCDMTESCVDPARLVLVTPEPASTQEPEWVIGQVYGPEELEHLPVGAEISPPAPLAPGWHWRREMGGWSEWSTTGEGLVRTRLQLDEPRRLMFLPTPREQSAEPEATSAPEPETTESGHLVPWEEIQVGGSVEVEYGGLRGWLEVVCITSADVDLDHDWTAYTPYTAGGVRILAYRPAPKVVQVTLPEVEWGASNSGVCVSDRGIVSDGIGYVSPETARERAAYLLAAADLYESRQEAGQ